MSRKIFRIILVALLVISGAFAAWSWLRPYEWTPDAGARSKIIGCVVKKDHSNYWVKLQVKVSSGSEHDLELPVRLLTAAGTEIEPAETTLEGDEEKAIRKLWLTFWLEQEQLQGPLELKINEGGLTVRSGSGPPKLGSDGEHYFVTHRW